MSEKNVEELKLKELMNKIEVHYSKTQDVKYIKELFNKVLLRDNGNDLIAFADKFNKLKNVFTKVEIQKIEERLLQLEDFSNLIYFSKCHDYDYLSSDNLYSKIVAKAEASTIFEYINSLDFETLFANNKAKLYELTHAIIIKNTCDTHLELLHEVLNGTLFDPQVGNYKEKYKDPRVLFVINQLRACIYKSRKQNYNIKCLSWLVSEGLYNYQTDLLKHHEVLLENMGYDEVRKCFYNLLKENKNSPAYNVIKNDCIKYAAKTNDPKICREMMDEIGICPALEEVFVKTESTYQLLTYLFNNAHKGANVNLYVNRLIELQDKESVLRAAINVDNVDLPKVEKYILDAGIESSRLGSYEVQFVEKFKNSNIDAHIHNIKKAKIKRYNKHNFIERLKNIKLQRANLGKDESEIEQLMKSI